MHDDLYGTLRREVDRVLGEGRNVVMDIDVQGAATIRKTDDVLVRDSLVDVFIMPPTREELERRLRKRGAETEEQVTRGPEAGRAATSVGRR